MLTNWSDTHPGIGQVRYHNIILGALQFHEKSLGTVDVDVQRPQILGLLLMRERYAIGADYTVTAAGSVPCESYRDCPTSHTQFS